MSDAAQHSRAADVVYPVSVFVSVRAREDKCVFASAGSRVGNFFSSRKKQELEKKTLRENFIVEFDFFF